MLLFVAGVPLFAMALADPHTGFTREEVSYPGRRIALLVDASTSMVMSFKSTTFKTQGESTFFTAVAGAEAFIQRRMKGPYRDVVALIQFGNQAYVVTPFTTDYENILLSVRLISDPREWGRFSDWGTTIIEGIDQATQLFKAFNFINASGNLMVVFTDGRDSELNRAEQAARQAGERGANAEDSGAHDPHRLQLPRSARCRRTRSGRRVVERTGGRFYAAYDDESLSRALVDIDRLSPGPHRDARVQRAAPAVFGVRAGGGGVVAARGAAEAVDTGVPDVSVRQGQVGR